MARSYALDHKRVLKGAHMKSFRELFNSSASWVPIKLLFFGNSSLIA